MSRRPAPTTRVLIIAALSGAVVLPVISLAAPSRATTSSTSSAASAPTTRLAVTTATTTAPRKVKKKPTKKAPPTTAKKKVKKPATTGPQAITKVKSPGPQVPSAATSVAKRPAAPATTAHPAGPVTAAPAPPTVVTVPPVAARVDDPIAPMAQAALTALLVPPPSGTPSYETLRARLAAAVATREWTATAAQLDQAWAKATKQRMTAVLTALVQLGAPYVFAAHGPDSFDCSGLTTFAWAKAGVSLVQQSEWQIAQSKAIPVEQVQPGDLIQKPGHVAMALGAGHVLIHAPRSGDVVRISDWGTWPKVFASPVG